MIKTCSYQLFFIIISDIDTNIVDYSLTSYEQSLFLSENVVNIYII